MKVHCKICPIITTRGNVQILRWTFHVSKQTRTLEISGKFVDNVPSTLQLFCRGKQRVREGRRVLREYSTPILIFFYWNCLFIFVFNFWLPKTGVIWGQLGQYKLDLQKFEKCWWKKFNKCQFFPNSCINILLELGEFFWRVPKFQETFCYLCY